MARSRTHPRRHIFLYLVLGFICLLVIFRIALPAIIKTVANKQLAKESPYFAFHIDKVEIGILKGEYAVGGITGILKDTGEQFLSLNKVEVSVPWKAIFDEKLVRTSVQADGLNLAASQALLDNAKLEGERVKKKIAEMKKDKPEKPEDKNKESKMRLDYFALTNSNITIHDFMSFKGDEIRKVTDINVLATNLIPSKLKPQTFFHMNANVFGPAPLNVVGMADSKAVPPSIDLNAELKNFDLPSINPLLREKLQAYFKKGKLDLYTEVASEGDGLKGYVRPFVSKMSLQTPPGGFKFTGVAAKTGSQLVKVLLEGSSSKTLATDVPFSYAMESKKLSYEIMPALQKAVVYKVKQNIQPGIADKIGMKGLGVHSGLIQAEEAK